MVVEEEEEEEGEGETDTGLMCVKRAAVEGWRLGRTPQVS